MPLQPNTRIRIGMASAPNAGETKALDYSISHEEEGKASPGDASAYFLDC